MVEGAPGSVKQHTVVSRRAVATIPRAMLRLVSLCGIFVMLAICFACSNNRRAIRWRLVGTGLAIQAVLGLLFLYWDAGNAALRGLGFGLISIDPGEQPHVGRSR